MQTELHTPLRGATPTQLETARKKREREQRIAEAAERLAQSKVVEVAPPVVPAVDPEVAVAQWVERQIAFAPMKATWFSIVEESAPHEPIRPRIEMIQRVVAAHYSVTRDDILSARRTAEVVMPRHVSMYFCRTMTLKSLPEIARRTGNRDHTVGIYAFRKVEAMVQRDPDFADDIEDLRKKIVSTMEGCS